MATVNSMCGICLGDSYCYQYCFIKQDAAKILELKPKYYCSGKVARKCDQYNMQYYGIQKENLAYCFE